ncbi:MAG: FtsW/RodA/SpoVE family cell cycle protein [Flavobacteriales bacterium]|nr:FtsW/RodA/SpoVE family cell cycle protein [Flavobacteriales bacterium]MCX7768358.1 FtsW/RodA/SpoVE family cell cycle protein [Flavobacteriales bacterium]MDW8409082.1 FtsW/RodA/SpoVE family cell cycle protein [Flavobacteriales bacterium]
MITRGVRISAFLQRHLQGDLVIWGAALVLALISLLEVYSTTGLLAYRHKAYNTEHYLLERLLFLGLGFGAMYVTHRIAPRYFSMVANLSVIMACVLLVITLLFGTRLNDANRWLRLPGLPFSFQPSDLAKMALVLFTARFLARRQAFIGQWKKVLLPLGIVVGVVCLLILPANFSTAAMLFFICLLMMFVARVPLYQLVGLAVIAGLVLLLSVWVLARVPGSRVSTWKARLESFVNGDKGKNYQTEYAQMAIATGRLTGSGPGNNPYRYLLPQGSSDFIFAMIAGEWGVLGSGLVLLLYLIIMYRSVRIALSSYTAFPLFLAIGIGLMITVQAFINMMVGATLLPVTGQPLPLVSMGGTGTVFTCVALGMLLSISRHNRLIKQKLELEENNES